MEIVRNRLASSATTDRAVSRQLGIGIAAAVIIAIAVLGVFVLQDQGPGEPQLEVDQEKSLYYWYNRGSRVTQGYAELNDVAITHTGGEQLRKQDLQVQAIVSNGSTNMTGYALGMDNASGTCKRYTEAQCSIITSEWNSNSEATIQPDDSMAVNQYIRAEGSGAAAGVQEFVTTEEITCPFTHNDLPGIKTPSNASAAEEIQATPPLGASDPLDRYYGWYAGEDVDPGTCSQVDWLGGEKDRFVRERFVGSEHYGVLTSGDAVRVVWSPPDADQSTRLVEYELD